MYILHIVQMQKLQSYAHASTAIYPHFPGWTHCGSVNITEQTGRWKIFCCWGESDHDCFGWSHSSTRASFPCRHSILPKSVQHVTVGGAYQEKAQIREAAASSVPSEFILISVSFPFLPHSLCFLPDLLSSHIHAYLHPPFGLFPHSTSWQLISSATPSTSFLLAGVICYQWLDIVLGASSSIGSHKDHQMTFLALLLPPLSPPPFSHRPFIPKRLFWLTVWPTFLCCASALTSFQDRSNSSLITGCVLMSWFRAKPFLHFSTIFPPISPFSVYYYFQCHPSLPLIPYSPSWRSILNPCCYPFAGP